jgi:CheY-like chemotaxis protein
VTAQVMIALLGALTFIAIAVACLATLRARAARIALRATEAKYRDSVELDDEIEAGSSLAAVDVAHDPTALPAPPVLVVEDEPRVRELIRLVLVRAGHEVVTVAGPHAALTVLNRQPEIPLMLVDVVLPEMDGYDLVAQARKISPGVHVVFISGFAHDRSRHPSGDRFLPKPFTVESLTLIVEEALSAAESRLPEPSPH